MQQSGAFAFSSLPDTCQIAERESPQHKAVPASGFSANRDLDDYQGVTVNPSSPITPLASAEVNHDQLAIELIEPDGMPPAVRITWPPQPTIIKPERFPEVAAAIGSRRV
jgi:hypothetical protein